MRTETFDYRTDPARAKATNIPLSLWIPARVFEVFMSLWRDPKSNQAEGVRLRVPGLSREHAEEATSNNRELLCCDTAINLDRDGVIALVGTPAK